MNVIKTRVDLTHQLDFQRSVNLVAPRLVVQSILQSVVTVDNSCGEWYTGREMSWLAGWSAGGGVDGGGFWGSYRRVVAGDVPVFTSNQLCRDLGKGDRTTYRIVQKNRTFLEALPIEGG
jgi:hypothetical protein